jgi:diaminopimelate epimerase
MSQLTFYKMHGLGNDFMVFDAINQVVTLSEQQIRSWSNRYTGVGFDQLLLVEKPTQAGVDFRYRIFNADGSEVAQCGNGARCFARFVRDRGLSDKDALTVETASGIIVLYLEQSGVRVNMGAPRFVPTQIPLTLAQASVYEQLIDGEMLSFGSVSMGNPHALIWVDDISTADVERWGKAVQARRDLFPEGVNVGFAQLMGRNQIRLRVYERGAGETQACGTGACAAMAICRQLEQVDERVTVSLPGGDLVIEWSGKSDEVLWMTGPAVTVFEGKINA